MKLIKKPLFWTNVATLSVTGMMMAGLAFGWTNPGETPPDGSGEVSVTSDRKVGVGTLSPTQKLDINGYLVGRTGFCLGKDDLTVIPTTGDAGLTSLSSAVLTGSHSTTDSREREFPSSHSASLSAMHDTLSSAGYVDKSTLRTASESGITTLIDAATGRIVTSGTGAASSVSTVAYKAIGCRTTWPAPGVGVEKTEGPEIISGSGLSVIKTKSSIATFGTPSSQIVNKNRLAKFVSDTPGQETIGNANIIDDGSTVSVTSNFSFSGKLVGGAVPWGNLSEIPKIDCGAGKVLQGIFPTKCVTLTSGASAPAPAPAPGPATCTSSIPATGPGPTSGTAICGLTCTIGAKVVSYTGSGTPYAALTSPPNGYTCSGKYTVGPSSITCSCL
ncbi:MAG: hypothetical protein G01um101419_71 [Parcubacteria group bacterium Gr01-1014_19]|nr:MAG: hypothetical protein G01um101419_71 [Parcubacteria group bacterium Gr01-1014_19]